jgi:acetolactate synthase-1/2/3 large subunit
MQPESVEPYDPAMETFPVNGGHVLVDAARRAGTSAIFAIHGVQIEPIFQACADLDVALVDVRHEGSAGFAAEAFSRLTGTLGVAAVCPGPGLTNVLTSMTNASLDRNAVVYVVGSTPESTLETNGLQVGIDHVALATPVTKWACKVHSIDQLPRIVAQAIRVATTAPRGPVLLDIPADVLDATTTLDDAAAVEIAAAGPAPTAADACLELLAAASRPVILLGGAPSDAARAAFNELLDVIGVPCFADYGAIGSVADDDDRYGGTLYQLGRLPAGERPDVALALGVRFGFDTPGLRDGGVAWGTTVLHVDSDPAEVGRFAPAAMSVIADPDEMIAALAARSRAHVWKVDPQWTATVRASLAATRSELDAIEISDGSRLHPYAAGRVASDVAARRNAVIVGDGAVCKHWLHDALRLPSGAHYVTHSRLGCMGQGHGAAMGAAKATPGRPVVCITGDGAVGFAIGEFEAMVRHGLPITVVVMNNAQWGASQGFQMRPEGRHRVVGTALSDANYHEVMIAFGGRGARVDTLAGLEREVEAALTSGVATCINVSTNTVGLAPEIPQLNGP